MLPGTKKHKQIVRTRHVRVVKALVCMCMCMCVCVVRSAQGFPGESVTATRNPIRVGTTTFGDLKNVKIWCGRCDGALDMTTTENPAAIGFLCVSVKDGVAGAAHSKVVCQSRNPTGRRLYQCQYVPETEVYHGDAHRDLDLALQSLFGYAMGGGADDLVDGVVSAHVE